MSAPSHLDPLKPFWIIFLNQRFIHFIKISNCDFREKIPQQVLRKIYLFLTHSECVHRALCRHRRWIDRLRSHTHTHAAHTPPTAGNLNLGTEGEESRVQTHTVLRFQQLFITVPAVSNSAHSHLQNQHTHNHSSLNACAQKACCLPHVCLFLCVRLSPLSPLQAAELQGKYGDRS